MQKDGYGNRPPPDVSKILVDGMQMQTSSILLNASEVDNILSLRYGIYFLM
jgi:hypothetical protein